MIRHTERIQGVPTTTIVGLHFVGADPATTDRVLFAGWEGSFRFVFPVGNFEIDGGASWFPESYYEADESARAALLRSVAGDIAAWLTALQPRADRTIVIGASQGGDLAAALALLHPDLVALAAPIAALLPTQLAAAGGTCSPMHLLHGDADPVVPVAAARDLASTLLERGAEVVLHEYPGVGHEVPDQMRRDLRRIVSSFAGLWTTTATR